MCNQAQFGAWYQGAGPIEPQEYVLFVSSVSEAVASRPDAEAATRLWNVLDKKGWSGVSVGRIYIPLAQDNVGARMLKAMGWVEGTGLGAAGQGIREPVCVERNVRRKTGVGWTKFAQTDSRNSTWK